MPANPDAESYRLRFGPYLPPKVQIGDEVQCEVRGLVTVADWSDRGSIMWPRCKTAKRRALILTGDLVRACSAETELAVAKFWNVSVNKVWRWKSAIDAPARTPGTEEVSSKKSSDQMSGCKALPQVKAALLRAAKRPKPKRWRARLAARNKLRALLDGKYTTAHDADRLAEMLLMREQGKTLAEIGQAFGFTRQNVEQILSTATTRRQRTKDRGYAAPRCPCQQFSKAYAYSIGHVCSI